MREKRYEKQIDRNRQSRALSQLCKEHRLGFVELESLSKVDAVLFDEKTLGTVMVDVPDDIYAKSRLRYGSELQKQLTAILSKTRKQRPEVAAKIMNDIIVSARKKHNDIVRAKVRARLPKIK